MDGMSNNNEPANVHPIRGGHLHPTQLPPVIPADQTVMKAAAFTAQVLALRTAGYVPQTMSDVDLMQAFDDVLDGLADIVRILDEGIAR